MVKDLKAVYSMKNVWILCSSDVLLCQPILYLFPNRYLHGRAELGTWGPSVGTFPAGQRENALCVTCLCWVKRFGDFRGSQHLQAPRKYNVLKIQILFKGTKKINIVIWHSLYINWSCLCKQASNNSKLKFSLWNILLKGATITDGRQ